MTDYDQQALKAIGLLAQRALDRQDEPIQHPSAWLSAVGRRIRDERGEDIADLIAAGATAEQVADLLDRPATLDEILDRLGNRERAKAIAAGQAEIRVQEAQTVRLRENTRRVLAAREAWRPPSAEDRLTARIALAEARDTVARQTLVESWHERAVEERRRAWEARFDG